MHRSDSERCRYDGGCEEMSLHTPKEGAPRKNQRTRSRAEPMSKSGAAREILEHRRNQVEAKNQMGNFTHRGADFSTLPGDEAC